MKKKISKQDEIHENMEFYLKKVKSPESMDTFWGPRMDELLHQYFVYLQNHPNELGNVLKAYAWHAFNYALKQR